LARLVQVLPVAACPTMSVSVPLPVLEERINRFIAEGGPDPYAGR
jgi:hypothetical protein